MQRIFSLFLKTPHPSAYGCHLLPLEKAYQAHQHRLPILFGVVPFEKQLSFYTRYLFIFEKISISPAFSSGRRWRGLPRRMRCAICVLPKQTLSCYVRTHARTQTRTQAPYPVSATPTAFALRIGQFLTRWSYAKKQISLYPVSAQTKCTPAMHFQWACRQCVHESARLLRVICSHAW